MFGRVLCKGYPISLGVLALAVLSGGCAPENRTLANRANLNWELAWKAADSIPSPLDAGTTKVRICNAAALSGQFELLDKWCAIEQERVWVKLACEIEQAYAEAIFGKTEKHEVLMQTVVRDGKQLDEWDQQRITNSLLAAIVAGRWQKSQDFQTMKKWIFEDEVHRMPAATRFFCDWLTCLRQHVKEDKNMLLIVELLMGQRMKFSVVERLRLCAQLAPLLHGTPWDSIVQQEIGQLEKVTLKPDCQMLLDFSQIYAGLGKKEKADELISHAQAMIEAKDTGECLAPWAVLAEAKAAAGRNSAEITQAFELGIQRSSDRPGYFKPVAEALTYAMRAQHETLNN